MTGTDRHVVIRRGKFARAAFSGWTGNVVEAGLFSRAEAEDKIRGSEGDGWSHQPLSFYADYFENQRRHLEEKFAALGAAS